MRLPSALMPWGLTTGLTTAFNAVEMPMMHMERLDGHMDAVQDLTSVLPAAWKMSLVSSCRQPMICFTHLCILTKNIASNLQ
jgi:hypothetical protein